MAKMGNNPLRLVDLVDLECQLVRDEALDAKDLRTRDRRIGRQLAALAPHRRDLLLAWLKEARDPHNPLPGQRAIQSQGIVTLILAILGLLIGWGVAASLFSYDGTDPVNTAHVLAAFVGVQLLLLLLLVLAVLPTGWLRWMPGAAAFQHGVRLLSPGHWASAVARILPRDFRTSMVAAMDRLKAFDRLYGGIRLWSLLRIAQVFGIAFNVGAILCALSLIVFTDLAFSWSTTLLNVGAEEFHELTTNLSRPWANWLPGKAEPDIKLVEATRYFREDSHSTGLTSGSTSVEIQASGGWWPFLVACMVFYGLLPRVLAWLVATWRLRVALTHVKLNHASCERLYERLTEKIFETRAPKKEQHPDKPEPRPVEAKEAPQDAHATVLNWSGVGLDQNRVEEWLERRFRSRVEKILDVGGLQVDADKKAIDYLAKKPGEGAVWILTKAWEAPTRDLKNFVQKLRSTLGDGRMVVVVPVELDESGHCISPDPADLGQWTERLRRLEDPWLRVESMVEET